MAQMFSQVGSLLPERPSYHQPSPTLLMARHFLSFAEYKKWIMFIHNSHVMQKQSDKFGHGENISGMLDSWQRWRSARPMTLTLLQVRSVPPDYSWSSTHSELQLWGSLIGQQGLLHSCTPLCIWHGGPMKQSGGGEDTNCLTVQACILSSDERQSKINKSSFCPICYQPSLDQALWSLFKWRHGCLIDQSMPSTHCILFATVIVRLFNPRSNRTE